MGYKTLFHKTNTDAIVQWTISVREEAGLGIITTEFGQVGGKLQVLHETISKGKSVGKKNATTAIIQAEKEAEARWKKQKKKGYVESIESANNDEVSEEVEGGILPMLAPNKSYPKDEDLQKRIVYPCYVQPKLDGMRCIAIIKNGICEVFSRTRHRIKTVPHVVEALQKQFPTGSYILDGELYSHEYRSSFEELISILRKDEPDAEGLHLTVQYHVYDCAEISTENTSVSMETPFKARFNALTKILTGNTPEVVLVPTHVATSLESLNAFYDNYVELEYEGAMARNGDAPYESGKRSIHLQKMKPFEEREFKIIDINEGRGKDVGTAATFTCITDEGVEFRARLKGTYAKRRHLLNHPEEWQGKMLTVVLKRFTAAGAPYLPVAKAIREKY